MKTVMTKSDAALIRAKGIPHRPSAITYLMKVSGDLDVDGVVVRDGYASFDENDGTVEALSADVVTKEFQRTRVPHSTRKATPSSGTGRISGTGSPAGRSPDKATGGGGGPIPSKAKKS